MNRHTTCNPQLKSFTVMEVIVTMVLSGIIIAAALSLYLNYANLVRLKNNQMNCGKENLQFYQIFKHEFDKASLVKAIERQVTLIQPDKTTIQYDFDANFIIRSRESQTDTFFIKVNDFEFLRDEITTNCKTIKMELHNCGEVYPVLLSKQYSNDILMNSSP
jgi:type II secretory pathway pseudopilin PulG